MLMQQVRQFWYNNEPGPFMLGESPVTRKQIQTHGGPAPSLAACRTCQAVEWLSRVRQQNLFRDHVCPAGVKRECQTLCGKQGDDLWTNYHQNFWYSEGCDAELNAPRACLFMNAKGMHTRYWTSNCGAWMNDLRRALAQTGTVETKKPGEDIDWSRYDWVWMVAKGHRLEERPPVPIVMFGGDTNHGNIQELLDLGPDILWTPYPSAWRDNFRIADKTQVTFTGCKGVSSFFTRPDLSRKKEYDLLVIGALGNRIYVPRQRLTTQIEPLAKKYDIGFSHLFGWQCCRHYGPVQYVTTEGKTVSYLNKWSEYLASARYVIFGGMAGVTKEYVTIKVYECLGSGAIPILPEVKDFRLLGIKPMVHYIPLSQVWKNNARLEQLLNRYDDYKYIAVNAVQWHKENMDKMLFDDFESLIHAVTDQRYPKRLL